MQKKANSSSFVVRIGSSVMDDVVFGHEDTETSEVDELEDELSLAGLDATELEYMDADERREALEDAGLDPDDYDFD